MRTRSGVKGFTNFKLIFSALASFLTLFALLSVAISHAVITASLESGVIKLRTGSFYLHQTTSSALPNCARVNWVKTLLHPHEQTTKKAGHIARDVSSLSFYKGQEAC